MGGGLKGAGGDLLIAKHLDQGEHNLSVLQGLRYEDCGLAR